MKSFYDLASLPAEEVFDLVTLARRLQDRPEPRALDGKVLSMLFLSPSLRTLSSFQAAMIRMGGGAFVISPEMSIHRMEVTAGVVMDGKASEHILEAIPTIASYGDAMGIRVVAERRNLQKDLADKAYLEMAKLVKKPLVNLESAAYHPCQALGDWKTLDELAVPRERGKIVVSWVYDPQAGSLAGVTSTVQMAAMRGMDVTVLRPPGFELPDAVLKRAQALAAKSGGSVRETADRREALAGAHVIYAKDWSSTKHYGDAQEDNRLRHPLTDWCVGEEWFRDAAPDARLLHSMPVRRGVAVRDAVLDGARSAIIHQAENRMWAQMAVLYRLMKPVA